MKQYRPQKRGSQKSSFNRNTLMAICGIAAAVIIIVIVAVNANSNPKPVSVSATDTFASNVTINGVSVGGMTTSEAKGALKSTMEDTLSKAVVQIKVPSINKTPDAAPSGGKASASPSKSASASKAKASAKASASPSASPSDDNADTFMVTAQSNVVQYNAEQLGITLDMDTALQQAMEYSLSGKAPGKGVKDAPQMDFTLLYKIDQGILNAQLQKDAASWTKPAQDAGYKLQTSKDDKQLTTSATPVKTDAAAGTQVDVAALVKSISDMINSQSFGLIQAPVIPLQPKTTTDNLQKYQVIGAYTTKYETAPSNRAERMYNIWKMSSILNGTVIQPGQTISVNKIAGPRTLEGGWQAAPGIENGVYSDQPGGGICQVSTTLYNAAIRAELKIVYSQHHTYPSAYVPHGLDATISTDDPDLKIQNNKDYPVLIAITCSVPKRNVQVSIYGVETRDYTLNFTSTDVQTIPPTPDTFVQDPTVPPGPPVQKMAPHTGYVTKVSKIWLKDGQEYKRDDDFDSATYKPSGAVWAYNPTTPPTAQLAAASAAAAAAAAASASPGASATQAPSPSAT